MGDANDRTQNVTLWDNVKGKNITVTTDGAKERLDVDIGDTGVVDIRRPNPKFDFATPGTSLTNGVDTSIKTITAEGEIDFIQVVAKNSNYEMIFIVDGVETLRISQTQLGTIGLLSSNSTGIPIYAASASKIFSFHPFQPDHFTTSFEVQIKATSAGNTLDGWFIHWSEF
jgi:hypothetical protein